VYEYIHRVTLSALYAFGQYVQIIMNHSHLYEPYKGEPLQRAMVAPP